MAVNTKTVKGRRPVRYASLDDLLADAKQLSTADARSLGNWSQGQIYKHLALSLNASIDGFDFAMPAPVRWMLSLLMKKKFLKKELPVGFKSTNGFIPAETPTDEGLGLLQEAVSRQKREHSRALHPAFGKLSREEWNDFHLRHAEMHMSFLIPA